jgi:hypothetical protein
MRSRYLEALDILREHDRAAALGEMARRNVSALKSSIRGIGRQIRDVRNRSTLQHEAEPELNRHFLNFLASTRQFLDHTEARLKRSYRERPHIYDSFKQATAKAYDESLLTAFYARCGITGSIAARRLIKSS